MRRRYQGTAASSLGQRSKGNDSHRILGMAGDDGLPL